MHAPMARDDMLADGLVTVTEAATFLGVGRTTVYVLMDSGQLHFVKIGKCRRIPKRALADPWPRLGGR
jgi:excisionase family DNA binding protein